MTNVVIASAARTPVGSFLGAFANTPAHELGRIAIEAVVERAGVDKAEVSETILGQVLTAAQGQNPARQAHINAGLPQEAAAWGINQVCGSGLRAVALGAQHIMLGDASIVVAGGQENMSMSAHAANLRQGQKMGDMSYIDTMIRDGLWDAFNGYHMGQTAENVAAEVADQPRACKMSLAVASQNKAEAAQKAGQFADEIVPFTIKTRKGDIVVDKDEYIRHGATHGRDAETAPRLHQATVSVTAGNASRAERWRGGDAADVGGRGRARAGSSRWRASPSYATAGLDPSIMGVGPDLRQPQGAGKGRLEGRAIWTWSRRTRLSRRRPAR